MECVWQEPSVQAWTVRSVEGWQPREPGIPASSGAREWNVPIRVLPAGGGVTGAEQGGGSQHKATSVLLGCSACE